MEQSSEDEAATTRALHLFVTLARCTHAVMQQAFQDSQRYGLKPSEFGVLELLYHKGPTPQNAISARLLLTMGSITHVVDQLQKKGLVTRAPCPADRRIILGQLTEAGEQLMAEIFPPHAAKIRDVVSALSAQEQEQAIAVLRALGMAAARVDQ